jgi:hypothetical protein
LIESSRIIATAKRDDVIAFDREPNDAADLTRPA